MLAKLGFTDANDEFGTDGARRRVAPHMNDGAKGGVPDFGFTGFAVSASSVGLCFRLAKAEGRGGTLGIGVLWIWDRGCVG